MSAIRLLVCCDANAQSGFGHFSRCLNLARELQAADSNHEIYFCGDYSPFAADLLGSYHFKQSTSGHFLQGAPFFQNIQSFFTHVLVDSYAIDQAFVDAISSTKLFFILMDDFQKHRNYSAIDLLINFTIQAPNLSYNAKRSALGIQYFPVKPELKLVRQDKLGNEKFELKSLAICMSAMPEYKALELEVLAIANQLLFNCRITLLSNHQTHLEIAAEHGNQILLQKPGNAMEEIYQDNDYIISGGGLVKYEAAFCGVPNATISLTEGVERDTALFEKENLTVSIGNAMHFNAADLKLNWEKALKSFNFKSFQESSSRLFNTESTKKLVNLITQAEHGTRS